MHLHRLAHPLEAAACDEYGVSTASALNARRIPMRKSVQAHGAPRLHGLRPPCTVVVGDLLPVATDRRGLRDESGQL